MKLLLSLLMLFVVDLHGSEFEGNNNEEFVNVHNRASSMNERVPLEVIANVPSNRDSQILNTPKINQQPATAMEQIQTLDLGTQTQELQARTQYLQAKQKNFWIKNDENRTTLDGQNEVDRKYNPNPQFSGTINPTTRIALKKVLDADKIEQRVTTAQLNLVEWQKNYIDYMKSNPSNLVLLQKIPDDIKVQIFNLNSKIRLDLKNLNQAQSRLQLFANKDSISDDANLKSYYDNNYEQYGYYAMDQRSVAKLQPQLLDLQSQFDTLKENYNISDDEIAIVVKSGELKNNCNEGQEYLSKVLADQKKAKAQTVTKIGQMKQFANEIAESLGVIWRNPIESASKIKAWAQDGMATWAKSWSDVSFTNWISKIVNYRSEGLGIVNNSSGISINNANNVNAALDLRAL